MSAHGEFDAIVIGSGMGGLAFASTMAKPRQWHVPVRTAGPHDRREHKNGAVRSNELRRQDEIEGIEEGPADEAQEAPSG